MMLTALSPQVLAAQTNLLWINMLAVAIIGLVAMACAVALKKS